MYMLHDKLHNVGRFDMYKMNYSEQFLKIISIKPILQVEPQNSLALQQNKEGWVGHLHIA